MLSLKEQSVFVKDNLTELGKWLDLSDLKVYADELEKSDSLMTSIEKAVAPVDFFRTKNWDGVLRLGLYRVSQYALARAMQATAVVETGVLHGLSSIFTLHALHENAKNNGLCPRLISIDYPSYFDTGPSNQDGFDDTLPPGHDPGWIIGESYKTYWEIRLGKSCDLLVKAVDDLGGTIDIFIHDSEHTYETMMFEFNTMWSALSEGGVLVADNIDVNTSFFDFSRMVNRIPFVAPADPDHIVLGGCGIRFGVLKK